MLPPTRYAGLVQVGPCEGGGAIRRGDMKLMVGTFGYAGLYGPSGGWRVEEEEEGGDCTVRRWSGVSSVGSCFACGMFVL